MKVSARNVCANKTGNIAMSIAVLMGKGKFSRVLPLDKELQVSLT